MKEARKQQACGAIRDRTNGHLLIVSACSTTPPSGSATTEIWDTVTNEVYYTEHSCPTGVSHGNFKVYFKTKLLSQKHKCIFIALQDMFDEAHLAFTDGWGTPNDETLYIFDLISGFSVLGDLPDDDISNGGSYVSPAGYHAKFLAS